MDFLAPYRLQLLSVLRIAVTLVFLEVPSAKFLAFPHGAHFDGLSPFAWPVGIAGIIETIFGLLLLFGLFGRLAAFILSGEMAFAYFIGHAPHGFFPLQNNGIPAVLWCFTFLYLAAAGPGPWSIDTAIRRKPATP
jgi:putative oxidoreductase